MTRSMGDATHNNVPALEQAGPWDMVAGYVTGTADIRWTAADFARFLQIPRVTIDQGSDGSPAAGAYVRDVEPGAWTPAAAVDLTTWWGVRRPTIYCDRADLPAVLAAGWQRDLWLAIPGWQPGQPLPDTPGCTVVAVQNAISVSGAFDMSVVLDPAWPELITEGDPMPIAIGATGVIEIYLLDGGKMSHIPDQASLLALTAAGVKQVTVTPACLTQFLADYPPGNPPVQVTVTG